MLFDSLRVMEACWGLGEVETVGGFRVRYSMIDYETSNPIACAYHPATGAGQQENNLESQMCLGLRLRMLSGQETITVTKYALMDSLTAWPIGVRLSEWYLAGRATIASAKTIQPDPEAPTIKQTRQQ